MSLKSYSATPTAPFASIKALIDEAAQDKLWLILTFHQIDDKAAADPSGEGYGTSPSELRDIVSYLASLRDQGILNVETMQDALPLIANGH